jgi:hypothetical protein
MSKTASPAPAAVVVVETVQLTLNEFCQRLSETVRRPELLSAFEYTERTAGRLKDSTAAFEERFEQFRKTPV